MKIMFVGLDNALNWVWVEDVNTNKCILCDWGLSDEEIKAIADRFRATGEFDHNTPNGEDDCWREDRFAIRNTMNGFAEIAWHE